nr:hypothetical protein [Rhizobium leguminosarum]
MDLIVANPCKAEEVRRQVIIADRVLGIEVLADDAFAMYQLRADAGGKGFKPITRRMITAVGTAGVRPTPMNGRVLTIHFHGDDKIGDHQPVKLRHDLVVACRSGRNR